MPRRPGPAPKENKVRRNVDPIVGRDGWTEVSGETLDEAPPIPEWAKCSAVAEAFYEELATSLPTAPSWTAGDWMMLWASLPLLSRYFERPGSESYKAWTSVLDPGLRITSDSMVKARVKVAAIEDEVATEQGKTSDGDKVTSITSRRSRLTG